MKSGNWELGPLSAISIMRGEQEAAPHRPPLPQQGGSWHLHPALTTGSAGAPTRADPREGSDHQAGPPGLCHRSDVGYLTKERGSRFASFFAGKWLSHCLVVLVLVARVRLFSTPQTVAHQAPLSMGFSRQEYGVGCHFLVQGILPTQGLNPALLHCRKILYHFEL